VRDWLLGSDATALWSQWDLTEVDVYNNDDTAYDEKCGMPGQLTCASDAECLSNTGHELVCQRNADGVRVCSANFARQRHACFTHSHCDGNTMCSGEGRCEAPQVSARNLLNAHVQQLFAQACSTPFYGLSEFQGVGDFTTANGMCETVNRFPYLTKHSTAVLETGGGGEAALTTRVRNEGFQRADSEAETRSLTAAGVLRAQPHPCDVSY